MQRGRDTQTIEEASMEGLRILIGNRGKPLVTELGRVLFKQGQSGNSFFYIEEGTIELQFDGNTRRILRAGNFFGEIAALSTIPRTGTARCLSTCHLIELSAEDLRHLIEENPKLEKFIISKLASRLLHARTRTNKQMLRLNDEAFQEILSSFEPMTIDEGEILLSQGQVGENLYLLLQGKVFISKDGKSIRQARPGDILGEISLLNKTSCTATALTKEKSRVLVCREDALDELLIKFPAFESYLKELAELRLSLYADF